MITGIDVVFEWDWEIVNITSLLARQLDFETFELIFVWCTIVKSYLFGLRFICCWIGNSWSLYFERLEFFFVAWLPIKRWPGLRPMAFSINLLTVEVPYRVHHFIISVVCLICTLSLEFDLVARIEGNLRYN